MKFQSIKIYGLAILALLLLNSCKKFVTIELAPDLIETSYVFSDDKTAIAAVNGVYTQLRISALFICNGGLSIYAGLSADELNYNGASAAVSEFFQNAISPTNATLYNNFWRWAYTPIYQTNSIIEGLSKSVSIADSLRNQLIGEAKTIRALLYFNLINLFGDVPLIISTDYQVNSVMPRTSVLDIYGQIISDLSDAQILLKSTYPSAGKVRPNKWTATALLARIYLYKKNWAMAEAQASAVINAGYSLVPSLNSVFLVNSNETIWEIASDNNNTAEGSNFIPASTTTKPNYSISNSLLNAFEMGDLRKATTNWLKLNTVSSVPYYYPNKYKERSATTPVKEYNIVLRLAEQFLIRAEARAQQGNIASAKADLDKIRTRAGLPVSGANDQASLLTAIEHERQTELFAEWGHRWFDLKRTNRAETILTIAKSPNWQTTDELYPIPFSQLQVNVFLTQNPGY